MEFNSGDYVSRMKKVMHESELRMTDVAIRSGVPISTISAMMNGRTPKPGAAIMIKIAQALNVTAEWLVCGDGSVRPALAKNPIDNYSPDNYVQIAQYSIEAGCGAAYEPSWEQVHNFKPVYIHKAFFTSIGVNNPDAIKIIEAVGDSMHPTISDGDRILIDTSECNRIIDGRIYAFFDGDFFKIKRLRNVRNGVQMHSDNTSYSDEVITGDDFQSTFKLVGLVVYRLGRI